MEHKPNGNGIKFKMSIRDIIWTIVLVVTIATGYSTFNTTVKAHIEDEDSHLCRHDIERITRMEEKIDALSVQIEHLTRELESHIEIVKNK